MQECIKIAEIKIRGPLSEKIFDFLKTLDVIVEHENQIDYSFFETYRVFATPESGNCVYFSDDGFSEEVHKKLYGEKGYEV